MSTKWNEREIVVYPESGREVFVIDVQAVTDIINNEADPRATEADVEAAIHHLSLTLDELRNFDCETVAQRIIAQTYGD